MTLGARSRPTCSRGCSCRTRGAVDRGAAARSRSRRWPTSTTIIIEVARLPLLRALLVARGARASARGAGATSCSRRSFCVGGLLVRSPQFTTLPARLRRSRPSGSGSPARAAGRCGATGRAATRSARSCCRSAALFLFNRVVLQHIAAVAVPDRSTTRTGWSTSGSTAGALAHDRARRPAGRSAASPRCGCPSAAATRPTAPSSPGSAPTIVCARASTPPTRPPTSRRCSRRSGRSAT